MRYAKTEWGIDVKIFSQKYGITLKTLAKRCDVNYNTLLLTMVGKTTGDKSGAVDKVNAFMTEFAATAEPNINRAVRTYEEM